MTSDNGIEDGDEPFGLDEMQEIAEELLGSIEWKQTTGKVERCPGEHKHTTPTDFGHCMIFLDPVPTIHCFHDGCREDVKEANFKLRSAIGKARWRSGPPSLESLVDLHQRRLRQKRANDHRRLLQEKAKRLLPTILKQFAWSLDEVIADSPIRIPDDPSEHWRLILSLFRSDETVWIGHLDDSGGERGARSFRKVNDWLERTIIPPGQFICPAVFAAYATRRTNESVLYKPT